ncbi:MAG: carboxymuconolactone decarboxylase family protein [Chloroflexi bacterium]|nr:carboxymuconolactone decarboxylase family protein [Chloroflexota bacterium]
MSQKTGSFLAKLEQVDPEFSKAFKIIRGDVATGALDAKTRSLVSLAVHIALAQGDDGSGAEKARSLGANDNEIKETIRIAFLLRGVPALVTGLAAF